jgi:hypothetical protein
MSAPRRTRHTAAFAATAAVAATVLLALGGAAVAETPATPVQPCSSSQDRQWPGTLDEGSTHCSDDYGSCLLRQPPREPQILEFDWRSADKACCYPVREPQILEFDWRSADDLCIPVP